MFNADRCYRSVKERAWKDSQPQDNRAEVKGNTKLFCIENMSTVCSVGRATVRTTTCTFPCNVLRLTIRFSAKLTAEGSELARVKVETKM